MLTGTHKERCVDLAETFFCNVSPKQGNRLFEHSSMQMKAGLCTQMSSYNSNQCHGDTNHLLKSTNLRKCILL